MDAGRFSGMEVRQLMPKPLRWQYLLPVALVVAVLGIYLLVSGSGIQITVSPVSDRKSNYHFIPEHWKEAKLRVLREQENYKDIPFRDQLDLFLKLCDWTHRQWPMSVPDPYPLSNALDILADIRAGRTGGFCGQYAYVLGDVLKSMGYFATRYVELWSASGESHFVVEAWCDQFGKWMILDPAENVHYVFPASGVPANAMEIRAGLKALGRIVARSCGEPRDDRGQHKMSLYAHFAVSTRSDLMRLAKPLTVGDRFEMFVFFQDGNSDITAFNGRIPYVHVTSRADDIYFDCNYVRVDYRLDRKKKQVVFAFSTEASMFNFDRFAVSVNQGENWRPSGESLTLPCDTPVKELWVAAVNMAGRFGRPTRIEITRD
jgi:hypothetical protein